MKVLLDTDIGSDVDDAWCLTCLLAQRACELVGITTVSGEPTTRAELASATCRHAGRSVPIHAGFESPLSGAQLQPEAPQRAALQRWDHATGFALEGDSTEAYNDVAFPDRVAPQRRTIDLADGGVTPPAHSVTVLKWDRR